MSEKEQVLFKDTADIYTHIFEGYIAGRTYVRITWVRRAPGSVESHAHMRMRALSSIKSFCNRASAVRVGR